jgi:hypothetical protein
MASSETRQMMIKKQVLSHLLANRLSVRDVGRIFPSRKLRESWDHEEAVKTRLVRARLKLREELSSYFHERVQIEKRNKNG